MRLLFIFILLVSGNNALAGDYTGKSEINWMSSIRGDNFLISGDWSNSLQCTNLNGNIWKILSDKDSVEDLRAMYSMALAAHMSGKTIELYAHECGSDGRPHARSLYIPSRSGN